MKIIGGGERRSDIKDEGPDDDDADSKDKEYNNRQPLDKSVQNNDWRNYLKFFFWWGGWT